MVLASQRALLGSFGGIVNGNVILEERGDGGFGYDSIFIPQGYTETFGELQPEIKNSLSHRGRALAKFWNFSGAERIGILFVDCDVFGTRKSTALRRTFSGIDPKTDRSTMNSSSARWQFWIDRGGTFTDIVGRAPDGTPDRQIAIRQPRALLRRRSRRDSPDARLRARANRSLQTRIESVKMGTTVATNALLERKGTRTALLINRGFADLLRIGTQQRPRLFDLRIVLPEQIYERVVEFEGRFSVEGEEIEPLELD